MTIDPTSTLNQPGITSQNGTQANSGQDAGTQVNSRSAGSNTLTAQEQKTGETDTSSNPLFPGTAGSLALDDDKNVVVRFYDDKGKVVAQFPPEDYLQMMKELNQVSDNLFHKTA